MNEVTIRGEVYNGGEVKEYGKNNFRKHEVVIKTGDERFPNTIPVEFIKEAIDSSTALREGQDVEIKCRLNGREWEKDGNVRYFVSVQGMEINFISEPAETGDAPF